MVVDQFYCLHYGYDLVPLLRVYFVVPPTTASLQYPHRLTAAASFFSFSFGSLSLSLSPSVSLSVFAVLACGFTLFGILFFFMRFALFRSLFFFSIKFFFYFSLDHAMNSSLNIQRNNMCMNMMNIIASGGDKGWMSGATK